MNVNADNDEVSYVVNNDDNDVADGDFVGAFDECIDFIGIHQNVSLNS